MTQSVAFFPWVSLDHHVVCESLRLVPYERARLPGNSINASQADLDGVLSAYALRKNSLVVKAALLELNGYHTGDDSEGHVEKLFRARELITFCALSNRRFFQDRYYCNFDTYTLVVQRYGPGSPGTFSFSTRRRDGEVTHLWGADEFAFLKPLHVDARAKMELDEQLLKALLSADSAGQLPTEAIIEFNRANTDSLDMPTHVEVVMMKSAFEWLLAIGNTATEFVDALSRHIPQDASDGAMVGPLADQWQKARPKAKRRLEAWAREFCDIRGSAAHGKNRDGRRFVWSEHAHLAFGALLFPLLLKQSLARSGFLEMDERDAIQLKLIEAYLLFDPFITDTAKRKSTEHPWSRLYSEEVLGEFLKRGIRSAVDVSLNER